MMMLLPSQSPVNRSTNHPPVSHGRSINFQMLVPEFRTITLYTRTAVIFRNVIRVQWIALCATKGTVFRYGKVIVL
jgi:hypothetical protein